MQISKEFKWFKSVPLFKIAYKCCLLWAGIKISRGPSARDQRFLCHTSWSLPERVRWSSRFCRSIGLVQYTSVNLFSKRPFDWLLLIFLPNEFLLCILPSVDVSIWQNLVVMKTKKRFLANFDTNFNTTSAKEKQENHSGPVSLPWDTIANYMGMAAILIFKS